MRRARIAEITEEEAVNLTPMLDVVFILLIFFIVTSSFVREAGIEVERPVAVTAEQQAQNPVLLALSAQNEIWLDQRSTDLRMIRPELEQLKSQQPDLRVVVQADVQARTGALVQLLDQIRLAEVPYVVATAEAAL